MWTILAVMVSGLPQVVAFTDSEMLSVCPAARLGTDQMPVAAL